MSGDLDDIDLNADGASCKLVNGGDAAASVGVVSSGDETLVLSVNGLKQSEWIDEPKDVLGLACAMKDGEVSCNEGGANSDAQIHPVERRNSAGRHQQGEEEEPSEKVELIGSLPQDTVSKDDNPTKASRDEEVVEQETDSESGHVGGKLEEKERKVKPGNSDCVVSTVELKGGRLRSKFSDSDLVWGKVRSHPWWPGQIFDASVASDKAKKYMKKERHLIAYFGDQSFAWNETSMIKPFRPHFSQMSKQSNLEEFHDALDCALDEVSRRVEFGLSCPCVAEHSEIRTQVIVNPGVRDDCCRRDGGDKCSSTASFKPGKLAEYVKLLGQSPLNGVDRLEFVTARAQLLALSRWKGYSELPELQVLGTVVGEEEADVPLEKSTGGGVDSENADGETKDDDHRRPTKASSSLKRKRHFVDGEQPSAKKERTLADFIAERRSSLSIGKSKSDSKDTGKSSVAAGSVGKKKRKAADSDSGFDDFGEKKSRTLSSPEGSKNTPTSSRPKGSFGIGLSILKVASQMNSPSPILKSHNGSSQRTIEKKGSKSKKRPVKSRVKKSPIKDDSTPTDIDDEQLSTNPESPVLKSHNSSSGRSKEKKGSRSKGKKGSKRKSAKSRGKRSPTEDDSPPTDIAEEQLESSSDIEEDNNPESLVNSPTELPCLVSQEHEEEESKLETGIPQEQESTDAVPAPEEKPLGKENGEPKIPIDEVSHDTETPEAVEEDDDASIPDQQNADDLDAAKQPPDDDDDDEDEEACPTALILNFTDIQSVPSVENLNKIFSRFGRLEESETQVMKKSSRAKVVFRRSGDAETAFSSAGKYSTFGPSLVSYRLKYLSSQARPSTSRVVDGSGVVG